MTGEQPLKCIVVGKECPVLGTTKYRIARTSDLKELHCGDGTTAEVVEHLTPTDATDMAESIEKFGLLVPFFLTWA